VGSDALPHIGLALAYCASDELSAMELLKLGAMRTVVDLAGSPELPLRASGCLALGHFAAYEEPVVFQAMRDQGGLVALTGALTCNNEAIARAAASCLASCATDAPTLSAMDQVGASEALVRLLGRDAGAGMELRGIAALAVANAADAATATGKCPTALGAAQVLVQLLFEASDIAQLSIGPTAALAGAQAAATNEDNDTAAAREAAVSACNAMRALASGSAAASDDLGRAGAVRALLTLAVVTNGGEAGRAVREAEERRLARACAVALHAILDGHGENQQRAMSAGAIPLLSSLTLGGEGGWPEQGRAAAAAATPAQHWGVGNDDHTYAQLLRSLGHVCCQLGSSGEEAVQRQALCARLKQVASAAGQSSVATEFEENDDKRGGTRGEEVAKAAAQALAHADCRPQGMA
jgi:hypothetical protein